MNQEFLIAGNEDLEEKTFHYLSGSLFDIIDECPNETEIEHNVDYSSKYSGQNESKEYLDYNMKAANFSRDQFGNLNESYGSRRFGAIFLDSIFSAANLNQCKIFIYLN